jgi:hypothetical protein
MRQAGWLEENDNDLGPRVTPTNRVGRNREPKHIQLPSRASEMNDELKSNGNGSEW